MQLHERFEVEVSGRSEEGPAGWNVFRGVKTLLPKAIKPAVEPEAEPRKTFCRWRRRARGDGGVQGGREAANRNDATRLAHRRKRLEGVVCFCVCVVVCSFFKFLIALKFTEFLSINLKNCLNTPRNKRKNKPRTICFACTHTLTA